MQIETERLILREMNEEDFDDLYCVLADSDIMQHYPYTFDEKESVDGLKKSGTVPDFWFRIVGCVPKRKWKNDW